MKLGIVGLPNVGKSTLFNSLTKAGAESANYPFCTIDPNIGIVSVPDERIVKLGELYNTKKVTPAVIEFVDIAGLVKGASKGEGLGNQFLGNIREVDAIVHVVRCFEDENIIHVEGSVDPERDIETINLELIFSDLEILERRNAKVAKIARMDKAAAKEEEMIKNLKAHLEDGKMARTFEVPEDEDLQTAFKGYNLLTAKPTIYAANVAEDDLADDGNGNAHMRDINDAAIETNQRHPGYLIKKVMWDAYTRETSSTGNSYPEVTKLVKQYQQQGALIMDYAGHGRADQVSHENVLRLADFQQFSNKNLPLWITAKTAVSEPVYAFNASANAVVKNALGVSLLFSQ